MPQPEARIRVSLTDGSFEIEGPEPFVAKQSEVYRDLIVKALERPPAHGDSGKVVPPKDPAGAGAPEDSGNVFHREGTSVKVLVDLPGNSQKEKTVSAALIALHALGGDAEVSFDAVRTICQDHSCLNKGNFSTYLKEEKRLFLLGGSGRRQTIRLTQPGKTEAKKVVASLAATSG